MSQAEKKHSNRASNERRSRISVEEKRESKSSYGGSISDIENDDSDKYRKIVKKLSRDKSDLKDKLRRLLDEVDIKNKEHRIELEKTQDYFQEQINDLVEERDRVRDEAEKIREVFLEEKEKLREQYDLKLSKQKETIEKRYGGKDSQIIKRLENTIATLQDRLTKQIEEREHVKDTAEQFYGEKEEELRKTIAELTDNLQKAKENIDKERRNFQILVKTYADEKQQIIRKMTQDKDDEITQIQQEKNTAIVNLQNIREQMEKRTVELDRRRDLEVMKAKYELDEARSNYDKKYALFKEEGKKLLEENKIEYENKLAAYENNFKNQIEEYKKESATLNENTTSLLVKKDEELRKIIERCNNEYQQRLQDKEKEINDLRLKNDKISGESEETIQHLKEQLNQVRESMKKIQDNSQTMNNQFVVNLNKQKELADKEIASRDQTIVYLERQARKIGEESIDRLNSLERKIRTTDEENKELNTKYAVAKATNEKYEQTINSMRMECQKLRELLEKNQETCKQLQSEKSIFEGKIKGDFDQKSKELSATVAQFEEYKKRSNAIISTLGNAKDQLKNVQINLDKNNNIINMKDKEIELLTNNLNSISGELSRIKSIYSTELSEKIGNVKKESDKQIDELTKKLNNAIVTIANFEKTSADTHKNLITVSLERDKYKAIYDNLEEKEKIYNETTKKLSAMEKNVQDAERAKVQFEHKVQLLTEKQKLLNDTVTEKDRQIAEISKKVDLGIQNYGTIRQLYTQLEQENKKLSEKHKQLTDGSANELNLKKEEIQKLQEEIGRLKSNFTMTLNNISTDTKAKDTELNTLRSKVKEYQEKDAKNVEIINANNSSQQEMKNTIDKLSTELNRDKQELLAAREKEVYYSKQLEENNLLKNSIAQMKSSYDGLLGRSIDEKNKEIEALRTKIANTEQMMAEKDQKVEKKIKEMIKDTTDSKAKFDEIAKENIRLQAQAEMSEKKLAALQIEYAQNITTIRSRQDHLKEREEELKKNEKLIRDSAPKLLDPSIKKARDEALANLRQAKIELTRAKDDAMEVNQKLFVAEGLVKDMEKEKRLILKAQTELKETFVNNLNQQQEKHEKELAEKTERIKELEKLLTEKLKAPQ
jgi:hypothetical protein